MGVRPAFDAVTLAMALGYDAIQLADAARLDTLRPDGSVEGPDGVVAPALPPIDGPIGLRAAPRPPIDDHVLDLFWDGILDGAATNEVTTTARPGPAALDLDPLRRLELLVAITYSGVAIDEAVGWVLFDIPIDCERADSRMVIDIIGGCAPPTTTATTVAPTSTAEPVDAATAATPSPTPIDPTSPDVAGDRAFVGTVQLGLGTAGDVVSQNDLYVIVTPDGLLGTFDYEARAADGSYCYRAHAVLDDRRVVQSSPGRFDGPFEVEVTLWDGECGSGEAEVFPLPTTLTGTLEGTTISGTLTSDGETITYAATLVDAGS